MRHSAAASRSIAGPSWSYVMDDVTHVTVPMSASTVGVPVPSSCCPWIPPSLLLHGLCSLNSAFCACLGRHVPHGEVAPSLTPRTCFFLFFSFLFFGPKNAATSAGTKSTAVHRRARLLLLVHGRLLALAPHAVLSHTPSLNSLICPPSTVSDTTIQCGPAQAHGEQLRFGAGAAGDQGCHATARAADWLRCSKEVSQAEAQRSCATFHASAR